MSKLLIQEPPLQVLPSLAAAIGLNQAIILQQIHYWMNPSQHSGQCVDGVRWIYNTYDKWAEQCPFWSAKTIGNIIRELETSGLLQSRQDLNAQRSDRTKWYTINYEHPVFSTIVPNGKAIVQERDHHGTETGLSSIAEKTTETIGASATSPGRKEAIRFTEFYEQAYPRRVAREAAWKAWQKLKPNDALAIQIITAARLQAATTYKDTELQYIPHPSKWLNAGQWEDEIQGKGRQAMNASARVDSMGRPLPTAEEQADLHRRHIEGMSAPWKP